MSCQGNLELNFQAQQINQNQLLPPVQPNQIDNPQPYIVLIILIKIKMEFMLYKIIICKHL